MDYIKQIKKIQKQQIDPVYFLHGTQAFIIEEMINEVLANTLSKDEQDMNVQRFRLADTPLQLIIEEAETLPFFSSKKVVIIQDFYLATSQKNDTSIDHQIESLEPYLKQPLPETVLIIIAPYEKLDERKKVTKQLKTNTTVVHAAELSEHETIKWIGEQANQLGIDVADPVKKRLVELAGTNLLQLRSELTKCQLYSGVGGEVTMEAVNQLVAKTLEQSIFDLIEWSMKGEISAAVANFKEMVRRKEEPLMILAMLVRQLRIYLHVKELKQRSYSEKQMVGMLKLHPYVVKLAAKQVVSFDEKKLKSSIMAAADTDYAIKTGKQEKEFAVELFIIKLGALSTREYA
ncbi:DNA polymerase III subunit delta [Alkalicoccobacillus plakortidis]|uniref:DNA polymerase III subunit delta n=1 Tax=Alkalicoccobacillus plakortidis TaxID=444060 RepID=A0ABT0XPS4_9BACI|nr:DNA polymerase III subunit delta [Alkalicoccobacillus plakortidis]MCM2677871.1 DNA polymerase III subunit delta [Alkalicoccobacillus plakortidis]